jgi:hypothetical protein
MATDLWLPYGFELPDGSKIRSLLYSGDEWQIFDTDDSNNGTISAFSTNHCSGKSHSEVNHSGA